MMGWRCGFSGLRPLGWGGIPVCQLHQLHNRLACEHPGGDRGQAIRVRDVRKHRDEVLRGRITESAGHQSADQLPLRLQTALDTPLLQPFEQDFLVFGWPSSFRSRQRVERQAVGTWTPALRVRPRQCRLPCAPWQPPGGAGQDRFSFSSAVGFLRCSSALADCRRSRYSHGQCTNNRGSVAKHERTPMPRWRSFSPRIGFGQPSEPEWSTFGSGRGPA